MREAWRLQKNALQNSLEENNKQLAVFLIYTGSELPQYPLVHEKIGAVIKRLIKICHEKVNANT
jgi:ribonuclease P protein component